MPRHPQVRQREQRRHLGGRRSLLACFVAHAVFNVLASAVLLAQLPG